MSMAPRNVIQSIENKGLFAALNFVRRGWPVLPLHSATEKICSCVKGVECKSQAKHPRTEHGLRDASSDPTAICSWWKRWPAANIGLLTGAPTGLLVIDVDTRHGGVESWKKFEAKRELPSTLRVSSSRGGFHLYYIIEEPFKNKVSLLPGVDVRADGGYIVAPGSIHASGVEYTIEEGSLDSIAPLPSSLNQILKTPTKSKKFSVPVGSRNVALASVSGSLRKYGLGEDAILKALESLNGSICDEPLGTHELKSIPQRRIDTRLEYGVFLDQPDRQ